MRKMQRTHSSRPFSESVMRRYLAQRILCLVRVSLTCFQARIKHVIIRAHGEGEGTEMTLKSIIFQRTEQ